MACLAHASPSRDLMIGLMYARAFSLALTAFRLPLCPPAPYHRNLRPDNPSDYQRSDESHEDLQDLEPLPAGRLRLRRRRRHRAG